MTCLRSQTLSLNPDEAWAVLLHCPPRLLPQAPKQILCLRVCLGWVFLKDLQHSCSKSPRYTLFWVHLLLLISVLTTQPQANAGKCHTPSTQGLQWSVFYSAMRQFSSTTKELRSRKCHTPMATGIDFIINNLTHLSLIFRLWLQVDLQIHIETRLWNSNIRIFQGSQASSYKGSPDFPVWNV